MQGKKGQKKKKNKASAKDKKKGEKDDGENDIDKLLAVAMAANNRAVRVNSISANIYLEWRLVLPTL